MAKKPALTPAQEIEAGHKLSRKFGLPTPPEELRPAEVPLARISMAASFHLLNELEPNNPKAGLLNGYQSLHRFTRNVLNQNPNADQVACKKGCWYCCTIPITAPAIEVLLTARYLQEHLNPQELSDLKARIQTYLQAWAGTPDGAKHRTPSLCPLNVAGLCIAHKARPSSCLRYHSLNVEPCIRMAESTLIPLPQSQEDGIQQFPIINNIVSVAFSRIQHLTTSLDLESRPLEFIPALSYMLANHDAEADFLDGKEIFEDFLAD